MILSYYIYILYTLLSKVSFYTYMIRNIILSYDIIAGRLKFGKLFFLCWLRAQDNLRVALPGIPETRHASRDGAERNNISKPDPSLNARTLLKSTL